MNPVWLVAGGVALLVLLRNGAINLGILSPGALGAGGEPEYFGQTGVTPIARRQVGATLFPTAVAPGDSPNVLNPNVAGPVTAPTGTIPIPAHVDAPLAQSPQPTGYAAPVSFAPVSYAAPVSYGSQDVSASQAPVNSYNAVPTYDAISGMTFLLPAPGTPLVGPGGSLTEPGGIFGPGNPYQSGPVSSGGIDAAVATGLFPSGGSGGSGNEQLLV